MGDEFLCTAVYVYYCRTNGRTRNIRLKSVSKSKAFTLSVLTWETFRDNYFMKGYYQAGNEPSFEIPWVYHYVNRPDLSALRVRKIVFDNFNTGIRGYNFMFYSATH